MEAFLRSGADFITAIDRVDEAIATAPERTVAPAPSAEPVPTAADNDRALAELKGLMKGL